MMSAWHLLWIIPVSGLFGYFGAALMAVAREEERRLTRHGED